MTTENASYATFNEANFPHVVSTPWEHEPACGFGRHIVRSPCQKGFLLRPDVCDNTRRTLSWRWPTNYGGSYERTA